MYMHQPASSTAKVEKQQQQKRGRKVAPAISRPTLSRYGLNKAKTGYVSENDDPTRPKSDYTLPTEDDLVNVE
ncbi:hypothetical protein H5410_043379 [Solanum commersonii]|uniref:Uncharacterized protein n=1 Tax=Solanum commersonii TaxID=4109 RepID=A0A9J5XXE0_SOLCO|nr:hypothetical protein H5410_043379 [Solanum commersonii]